MGSSVELGMPQNDHYLSRKNGNRSEPIPRHFFGTKFRSQPYLDARGVQAEGGECAADEKAHA